MWRKKNRTVCDDLTISQVSFSCVKSFCDFLTFLHQYCLVRVTDLLMRNIQLSLFYLRYYYYSKYLYRNNLIIIRCPSRNTVILNMEWLGDVHVYIFIFYQWEYLRYLPICLPWLCVKTVTLCFNINNRMIKNWCGNSSVLFEIHAWCLAR